MNAAPPTPMKFENMDIATLRDQFAMAALTGLLASRPYNSGFSVDDNVDDSFYYADAMLEARNQG